MSRMAAVSVGGGRDGVGCSADGAERTLWAACVVFALEMCAVDIAARYPAYPPTMLVMAVSLTFCVVYSLSK